MTGAVLATGSSFAEATGAEVVGVESAGLVGFEGTTAPTPQATVSVTREAIQPRAPAPCFPALAPASPVIKIVCTIAQARVRTSRPGGLRVRGRFPKSPCGERSNRAPGPPGGRPGWRIRPLPTVEGSNERLNRAEGVEVRTKPARRRGRRGHWLFGNSFTQRTPRVRSGGFDRSRVNLAPPPRSGGARDERRPRGCRSQASPALRWGVGRTVPHTGRGNPGVEVCCKTPSRRGSPGS
jgi:hypothetical protein